MSRWGKWAILLLTLACFCAGGYLINGRVGLGGGLVGCGLVLIFLVAPAIFISET